MSARERSIALYKVINNQSMCIRTLHLGPVSVFSVNAVWYVRGDPQKLDTHKNINIVCKKDSE